LEDISKLFNMDVREKKRTGAGIYSRTGKRGYVGTMRTATDFLSGKEKREYTKSSKVEVTNMYDKLVPFNDFKLMDNEGKKKFLEQYTKRYTVREIADQWNVRYNRVYAYLTRFDIPIGKKDTAGGKAPRKATTKKKAEEETLSLPAVIEKVMEESKVKEFGLSIGFNGEFTGEELAKKLEKIELILDDDGTKYSIQLKIQELEG
jgi:hypothetical protein